MPKKKGKTYRIEMTTASMSLWGIGLFLLLTWIFVLGILVGRGSLPSALKIVPGLEGQVAKWQQMLSRSDSYEFSTEKESNPDLKLSFYRELSTKKDQARGKVPRRPEGTVKPETEGHDQLTGEEAVKSKIEALRVELQNRPNKTLYTLQVASLEDKQKAESLMKRLADLNYPVYLYQVKVNGKRWYRVRCGKFREKEEARSFARKLAKEIKMEGFVSTVE
jgi:cell division protein FtsN